MFYVVANVIRRLEIKYTDGTLEKLISWISNVLKIQPKNYRKKTLKVHKNEYNTRVFNEISFSYSWKQK